MSVSKKENLIVLDFSKNIAQTSTHAAIPRHEQQLYWLGLASTLPVVGVILFLLIFSFSFLLNTI
jgi:hypothetical protein